MRVIWQCENNDYCSRVLRKHWPDVPNLGDVTKVDWRQVERPDLICGGYPCQPFSVAGTRRGTDDERHLWPYFRDALGVLRPEWALLENVPGHLGLGFGDVLADLAAGGYDVEWDCVPAAAVGAPHLRWRLFAVAYADREGEPGDAVDALAGSGQLVLADTDRPRRQQDPGGPSGDEGPHEGRPAVSDHVAECDGEGDGAGLVADAEGPRLERPGGQGVRGDAGGSPVGGDVADADARGRGGRAGYLRPRGWSESADTGDVADADRRRRRQRDALKRRVFVADPRGAAVEYADWWFVEPDVGRVAHGIPRRVDRLRGLGNAVVPQVAQLIGEMILAGLERDGR